MRSLLHPGPVDPHTGYSAANGLGLLDRRWATEGWPFCYLAYGNSLSPYPLGVPQGPCISLVSITSKA